MIGRAPERNRGRDTHQTGKQVAEPCPVIQREPACQQVLPRVVKTQACLHACIVRPQSVQGQDGFAQLERIGPVLRIEDRAERPARSQETVVAGLRFRLGISFGNLDHGQVRPGPQLAGRGNGLGVISLQQKPNIQLFPGVLNTLQSLDQLLNQGLFKSRDKYRVNGKLSVRESPGIFVCYLHHSPSPGAVFEEKKPEPERPDVGDSRQRYQQHAGDPGQKNQAEQKQHRDGYENHPLPSSKNAVSRIRGRAIFQSMTGNFQGLFRRHRIRVRKWLRRFSESSNRSSIGCLFGRSGRHRITPIRDRTIMRASATPTAT